MKPGFRLTVRLFAAAAAFAFSTANLTALAQGGGGGPPPGGGPACSNGLQAKFTDSQNQTVSEGATVSLNGNALPGFTLSQITCTWTHVNGSGTISNASSCTGASWVAPQVAADTIYEI
jgi:hypothetical protein